MGAPRKLLKEGDTFGSWVILGPGGVDKKGNSLSLCECSCGTVRKVQNQRLKGGRSRSCGHDRNITHGLTKHHLYASWDSMKQRCYNPNNPKYKDYGGRGIIICDRWLNDFSLFVEDMVERPPGLSIDRIDVNGNYEPSNCRWATAKVQRANQRVQ